MATIVMESAKVIEAAERTIRKIKSERDKCDNVRIDREMGRKSFSFRRGFYYKTRDEAIKALDARREFMGWRSWYAWEDLDKARNLWRIAKHGDPVTLNEDDVRVLF